MGAGTICVSREGDRGLRKQVWGHLVKRDLFS